MNWETWAAIGSVAGTLAAIILVFVKSGKLLQRFETLEKEVEENKQKSIDSDKVQYEKIHKNKVELEEEIESAEKSLKEILKEKVADLMNQIENNAKATDGVKLDLNAFRWDVTTHLLEVLKDNMTELVAREIEKLSERTDEDVSQLEDSISDTKEDLESKINKLEKKIENIEYKDIRPIRETIAKLKQQIGNK
jgi:uncharacterized protein YPO0396